MNKNTVLGWAALLMIVVGFIFTGPVAFKYNEIAGWGFGTVGISLFAIAWVFNTLKEKV